MKSYTDLEQSKKLAEILPVESADMGCNVFVDNSARCLPINDWDLYKDGSNGVKFIPAWSLAALIDLLPSVITRNKKRMFLTLEKAGAYNLYYKSPDRLGEFWVTKEDIIDAVVEMILTLPEQKLL